MALHLLGSARAGPEAGGRGRVASLAAFAAALVTALVSGLLLGRMSLAPEPEPVVTQRVMTAATLEDPGPRDAIAGVPVGYDRSAEGAAAAATGYTLTLADKRAFNPAWREAAYRTIATPDAYPALTQSAQPSFDRIADDLRLDEAAAYDGSVQAVTVPLGYRVDAYHSDRATVTVWAAGWLVRPRGSHLPLRARTMTFELLWTDGDWKIGDVSANEPLDPPGVTVPPTLAMQNRMATFTPYRWMPQQDG